MGESKRLNRIRVDLGGVNVTTANAQESTNQCKRWAMQQRGANQCTSSKKKKYVMEEGEMHSSKNRQVGHRFHLI